MSAGLLFGLITMLVQYVGLFMLGFHTGGQEDQFNHEQTAFLSAALISAVRFYVSITFCSHYSFLLVLVSQGTENNLYNATKFLDY